MFLQGCAGDQNPYPRGTGVVPGMADLDLAKQHGRTLANAAEMANLTPQREVRGALAGGPMRRVALDLREEAAFAFLSRAGDPVWFRPHARRARQRSGGWIIRCA